MSMGICQQRLIPRTRRHDRDVYSGPYETGDGKISHEAKLDGKGLGNPDLSCAFAVSQLRPSRWYGIRASEAITPGPKCVPMSLLK